MPGFAVPDLLQLFTALGVAVFAVTGALVAARHRLDPFGFGMLATVTGIGGGTLRDVLLAKPVFWVVDPRDLTICLAVSVLVFGLGRIRPGWLLRIEQLNLLAVADAAGVALFATTGAVIAREAGAGVVIAVTLGAITATFGGILRDVLTREPSLVMRTEIYVTAAALGAALTVSALEFGLGQGLSMSMGFAGAFALRLAAMRFGWSLPTSPRQQP